MSYQLELRHYRYFLTLSEELNFRKAAEKLFISQPGLSRQIKEMEEVLQTKLFTRDKKVVQLTPTGQYLKKEITLLVNHLENTNRNLAILQEGAKGIIRIGALGSAMHNVLPDLLLRMKNENPSLHFNIEELRPNEILEDIRNDRLDMGFVRIDQHQISDLGKMVVFKEKFALALPEKHHLTKENFKNLAQLKNENFIFFNREINPFYYDQIKGIFNDAGFEPIVSHKSFNAYPILKMVEFGFGIAVIPQTLANGYQLKIKTLEIPLTKVTPKLWVVWKASNQNTHLSQLLVLLKNLQTS